DGRHASAIGGKEKTIALLLILFVAFCAFCGHWFLEPAGARHCRVRCCPASGQSRRRQGHCTLAGGGCAEQRTAGEGAAGGGRERASASVMDSFVRAAEVARTHGDAPDAVVVQEAADFLLDGVFEDAAADSAAADRFGVAGGEDQLPTGGVCQCTVYSR